MSGVTKGTKPRARTAWDISLGATSSDDVTTTNGLPTSLASPRKSFIPRPSSVRHVNKKPLPSFWVNTPGYSVFSDHGIDAMVRMLESEREKQRQLQLSENTLNSEFNLDNPGSDPNSPPLSPMGAINNMNSGSQLTLDRFDSNNNNNNNINNINNNNIQAFRTSMSKSSTLVNRFMTPSLALVMQPENIDTNEWESSVKEWEADGEWVESRELLTGRILWFNTNSNRIVFDNPPDGIQPLPATQFSKNLGKKELNDEYYLNRPVVPYEGEDVVDSLLNFGAHQWNFEQDNDKVDVYRAQAARKNHSKMLPKPAQYVFPEYFSEAPLPELPGGRFFAKIKLPTKFSAHRQYVTIMIKADHTRADDAIQQGVKSLDAPYKDSNDFILKVVGHEEYIYGRHKVIDFEAVRMAVRNENDVEFVLIRAPGKNERISQAKLKQKEYEEKFKTAYPEELRMPEFLQYEDIKEIPRIDQQKEFEPLDIVSLYECDWHYRVKIEGLTNAVSLPRFDDTTMKQIYIRVELWMGDCIFDSATLSTRHSSARSEIRWGQWVSSRSQTFAQIPRESVLCFMVMGIDVSNNIHKCLAWCRMPLIDHRHRLRRGKYLLNMWEIPVFKLEKDGPKTDPYKFQPFKYRGTTVSKNVKAVEPEQCQLFIEFDSFPFEVIAPKYSPIVQDAHLIGNNKLTSEALNKQQKQQINDIIEKSPLEELKQNEKQLIWMARDLLWHDPKALPAFLRSVNWTNRVHIAEAHKYLDMWSPPKRPEDALEFLDYRFADTKVREKAIRYLEDMPDGQLQQYLLQLVQCLKYEAHHDNALSKFLIRRALKNPYQIGHFLFWHLKAEFHDLHHCERFGLVMEEYLKHAGEHSRQLFVQNSVLKRLEIIADKIAKAKHSQPAEVCKKLLRKELLKLNKELPDSIQIPLNPRWRAKKIIVDKCRYMSSKKVPLWLELENADEYANPIKILFKSGDDLRQDMLTLQMLSVMDSVWLDSKLDLHLKPYATIATGINKHGEGVGMIEVVVESTTINSINVKYGGAFNAQTIDSYLKEQPCNKGNQLEKARETFARSSAGYCVATFVMGIGDRHSDNIMVSKAGHIFHIDFGHFLGNFKSKFGVRRERSPFVFTPQMKYAIDGGQRKAPLYDQFLDWCTDSYNVLRARSRVLLVLFALMVSAGMPELMMESDILYFQDKLNLGLDIRKAKDHLRGHIKNSLRDRARLVDNAIHAAVHR